MEYLCQKKIIPSLIVTNDWFAGLIPGYVRAKAFGDTFDGTTLFHIGHNLEPSYEGRIYPTPHEGALEHVHGLPRDWLVNPYW